MRSLASESVGGGTRRSSIAWGRRDAQASRAHSGRPLMSWTECRRGPRLPDTSRRWLSAVVSSLAPELAKTAWHVALACGDDDRAPCLDGVCGRARSLLRGYPARRRGFEQAFGTIATLIGR